jgi:hypothetical protein
MRRREGVSEGVSMVADKGATDVIALLDKIIADGERAAEEARERLIEAEVQLRVHQELQRRAEVPKRSEMSALAKSQYIKQHGVEKCNELPWK